jgi:hypothetical protein
MADTKISALPAGTVTPASILPAVNGAVTQRVTVQQLLDVVGTVSGPAGADGADGPAGVDGESVTVFEQPTAPVALRTGDLWLEPVPAPATGKDGLSLAEVEAVVDDRLSKLPAPVVDEQAILDSVKLALNGGVMPPPDILAWTKLPIGGAFPGFAATTNVEGRQINGVIYLRGTGRMSSGNLTGNSLVGFSYLELPPSFAKPSADVRAVVTGRVTAATSLTIGTITVTPLGFVRFQIGGCDEVFLDSVAIRVI